MTAPQFNPRAEPLSVAEIVALTGAMPRGDVPLGRLIDGIAALDRAGPRDLAFLDDPRSAGALAATRAGACLLAARFAGEAPARTAVLVADDPYAAFVAVARRLFSDALRPSSLAAAEGVAAGAHVHAAARLEADVRIDPGAVVGPQAEIGGGTVIGSGAVVGPGVRVGRDCAIGAGASVTHALLGDRVIVRPGCRIGQDGFAHRAGADAGARIPFDGRVIVQDGVEIGANSTVDRGTAGDTVIGEGTMIDNLVAVGHNAEVGRHCRIAGQTRLAAGVRLGDFVTSEAGAVVEPGAPVADGVRIASRAAVPGGAAARGPGGETASP